MLKRSHYIILSFVVVLALLVLNLPRRTVAQLKLAISSLYLPLFGVSSSTQALAANTANTLLPKQELLTQLEAYRLENDRLRMETMRLQSVEEENRRLRYQLSLPRAGPWKYKLARVVARDPANWWRNVRIDVGLRDGATTNSPVLTPQGLVGRVSEPGYAQSRVVLLGDPDCRVAALVQDTRDNGVIAPASSAPVDPSIVDLGYLSRNSQLRPGQLVVTSGLGGVFPPGIVIGQVVDFRSVDFGLYSEARVKLAVQMNELEEVWVLLP